MKYCKVSIQKTKANGTTTFAYPEGYDARDFEIILYQDPHAGSSRPDGNVSIEFAAAIVPDDYDFPAGSEELTEAAWDTLVDGWIDTDQSALGILTAQQKTDLKASRKNYGHERAAAAKSKADARSAPPPGAAKNTFKP